VPFITGYVIFRWWPHIKDMPVKPAYVALIPLAAILFVTRAAVVNQVDSLTSVCFIGALLCGTAFVAGWRWMLKLALPTMYLAFALPLWNMAITVYTNPLQVTSTKVAFKMLELTGFHPYRDSNVIYLSGFTLDVGVPCSGLKLVLALYAFTMFFALIARLKWGANLILILAVPLPLALFINGLRIMLIGVVGVNWGSDAAHKFHDYSGYIALIVCFFLLFRIARWLGWKD
jgi:exosortase